MAGEPAQVGKSDRTENSIILSVQRADLHYGAAKALRSVSLDAAAGEITCVLGRNGVGKTSLLRAVVGHHPLSS